METEAQENHKENEETKQVNEESKTENENEEKEKKINNEQIPYEEEHFKVVLVGNVDVGKTSLIHRIANNEFDENGYSLLAIPGFSMKKLVDPKTSFAYYIDFWDTGGSKYLRPGNSFVCADAHAIVYVASFDNEDSLKDLPVLQKKVDGNKEANEFVPIFIINKDDLEEKKVTDEQIQAIEQELGNCQLLRVSAKTGQGTQEFVEKLATEILQMFPLKDPTKEQPSEDLCNIF